MINRTERKVISSKYTPVYISSLAAIVMSVYWKISSLGGPIISDEWTYLEPIRNTSTDGYIISNTGNYVFNFIIQNLINQNPISQQYSYLLFNLILFKYKTH
jgi:hypothetical protein